MPRRRLQMAGFVERCLSMFSGSFQCNFLPLSTGTQPVKGHNEAWSPVLDEERQTER